MQYEIESKQKFKGVSKTEIIKHEISNPCVLKLKVGMEYILFFNDSSVSLKSGSMAIVNRITRKGYLYKKEALDLLKELKSIRDNNN